MRNAPRQNEDDLVFEKLFSDYGEQSTMSRLMGVSATTFKRQLVAANEEHPSDYHRGRRLAYAAGYRGDERGETVKRGFDEAFEAGRRDAGHGGKVRSVEGASVLHRCMSYVEAYTKDETEELRALNLLIAEATARRDALYEARRGAGLKAVNE